jgi:hypothetical protein
MLPPKHDLLLENLGQQWGEGIKYKIRITEKATQNYILYINAHLEEEKENIFEGEEKSGCLKRNMRALQEHVIDDDDDEDGDTALMS